MDSARQVVPVGSPESTQYVTVTGTRNRAMNPKR